MVSSGVEVLRSGNEDYAENTCSHGSTLRENQITTEVRLVQMGLTRENVTQKKGKGQKKKRYS